MSNASAFVFNAAFGWYVLELTGSASLVGFAFLVSGLPWLLLIAYAGLLTDRHGPRTVLAVSFSVAGVAMVALGLMALAPPTAFGAVLVLAFVVGTGQALGAPGSVSIVNDLVPRRAVSSAVSLNFLGINVGRIGGGLLGGILIAAWPAGWALVVGGLLQAAPALPIWRLQLLDDPDGAHRPSAGASVIEAARYGAGNRMLAVLLLLSGAPGIVGLSYTYVLPVAAREMGIGGAGLGMLLAAAGLGGLAAGLAAEALMGRAGHGRAVLAGLVASAAGLAAFGAGGPLPAALLAMAVVGAGFVVYASASLSLIQALSPNALRGRVTGLFALLYWGLNPLGAFLGGLLAAATSGRTALGIDGGLLLVAGAVAVLLRREVLALRIDDEGRVETGLANVPA